MWDEDKTQPIIYVTEEEYNHIRRTSPLPQPEEGSLHLTEEEYQMFRSRAATKDIRVPR